MTIIIISDVIYHIGIGKKTEVLTLSNNFSIKY